MLTKKDTLKQIEKDVHEFKESPLFSYRTENNYKPVIGEGDSHAQIVFIGEAPGKNEAKSGKPFCGAAGKILDELLTSIKLQRSDVYITNIVKDRPQENRDPTKEEIAGYGPFLDRQLKIIQPQIIVTLGRFSMTYIINKTGLLEQLMPISQAHGKVFEGQLYSKKVIVVPLYHPAAAIYNRKLLPTLLKDFQILKNIKT